MKHNDVPSLGRLEVVKVLQHQEPVAAEDGCSLGHRLFEEAVGADGSPHEAALHTDGKLVAALAPELGVSAVEGRGHRAGGDDKRLDDEGPEDKREHERDDDRLERLEERLAVLAALMDLLKIFLGSQEASSMFTVPRSKPTNARRAHSARLKTLILGRRATPGKTISDEDSFG